MMRRKMDGRRMISAACFVFGSVSTVILSGLVSTELVQTSAAKILTFLSGGAAWRMLAAGCLAAIAIQLAGLSLAGVVLIPAATVLFGAVFGWTVSCLRRAAAIDPRTVLLLGAAALPMLPAVILLGASGLRLSAMLRAVILHGGAYRPDFRAELLQSAVIGAVIPLSLLLLSLCLRSGI